MSNDSQCPIITPGDHTAFMSYAIQQALLDTSPPAPGKYRVGAVLINVDTGTILSTGYSLELPGNMENDVGSTHAEQVCFIKVAKQHGLSIVRAERQIAPVLPERIALYTTMEPCRKRSVQGAVTCCERLVALKAKLSTVYVGLRHLQGSGKDGDGDGDESEGEDKDDAGWKKRLKEAGVEFVMLQEMEKACLEAATG